MSVSCTGRTTQMEKITDFAVFNIISCKHSECVYLYIVYGPSISLIPGQLCAIQVAQHWLVWERGYLVPSACNGIAAVACY